MSTILRRRGARLGDLHIYRRQDSPAPPPPPSPSPSPDVGSDSDDEGDELGGPDTPSPPPSPSPTQTTFPPGVSTSAPPSVPSSAPPGIPTSTTSSTPVSVPSSISTSTSSPAIQPTTSLDNTGTEIPDASRTSLSASPATEETTVLAPSSTSGLPDNTQEQQQPELGQSTSQPGLMGSGGVIAMATLIGLAVLAIAIFCFWRCRRRRNRSNGGRKPRFTSFARRKNGSLRSNARRAPTQAENQAKTMDELMTAAYAVESGEAYGTRPGSHQSLNTPLREKGALHGAYAPSLQKPEKGSLYAKQLLEGFWKRAGEELPAVPGKARVPPPAPSVAGRTEMTSQSGVTESTWNTWGVMQHHSKQKDNWLKKYTR